MMRDVRLLIELTLYYVGVFVGLYAFFTVFPALVPYLPIGGTEELFGAGNILGSLERPLLEGTNTIERSIRLALATLGAILIMVPVSWTYMSTRRRKGREQALVETMILLPIAVAAIVLIVQNSLALAFSLAGIVAAVRFRHTIESTADALYIIVAVGVGLAAGVEALSFAIVMTLFFNYTIVVLWHLDYGAADSARYMRSHIERPDDEEEGSVETIAVEDD